MSQDTVLKVLKKKRKWMISKEVADALGIGTGSVSASLGKLYNQGLLKRRARFLKRGQKPFEYKIKWLMNLQQYMNYQKN